MKNNLVIGGDSFIGRELAKRLACDSTSRRWHEHHCRHFDVLSGMPPVQAKTVYMCAAITGFAECERNPDAYRVNVDAPIRIAREMSPESRFVFLSSEAVRTALHTNYGMMKAMAEIGLSASKNTVIVRLPHVTSENLGQVVTFLVHASSNPPGIYEYGKYWCPLSFEDQLIQPAELAYSHG